MADFKEMEFKAFELFEKEWALVTAGNMEHYNGCTVGWGSLGNFWSNVGRNDRPIVTVMIHPARYTSKFMLDEEYFTVSFFDPEYKKALGYMGSHSGREEDKARGAGLTPMAASHSVTFKEAKLTFVCKKVMSHEIKKEELDTSIQEYYAEKPAIYTDGKDGWTPHYMFMGEVVEVIEG